MNNDIFFLGAGFSKSIIAKYPTLKKLSEIITEELLKDKSYVGKYYKYEIPKKFYNNIEVLLSYLLIDLPYKYPNKSLMDRGIYKDIINKISDYFKKLNKNFPISVVGNKNLLIAGRKVDYDVNRFADYILRNKCNCITLNYDTLLEDILYYTKGEDYRNANKLSTFYKIPIEHLSKRGEGYIIEPVADISSPFDKIPEEHLSKYGNGKGYVQKYNEEIIEEAQHQKDLSKELSRKMLNKEADLNKNIVPDVTKLHGSINWLYSENANHHIYFNDTENDDFKAGDLEPFIIPPVLDKSALYNNTILRLLWQSAFEAIQKARNIYIYGFSFPETDYSIKYLFQSALKDRYDYEVYVINKCDNKDQLMELKKKYNDIFGKEHCNYYCCVEEGQLARLIDIMDIMDIRDIIDGI